MSLGFQVYLVYFMQLGYCHPTFEGTDNHIYKSSKNKKSFHVSSKENTSN